MRIKRSRLVALGLVVTATAALGWGVATYAWLARQQQGVARACSRLDAACRVRLERVENLLLDAAWAGGGHDAASLERVRVARDRALALGDHGAMIDEPWRYREFRRAQADLTDALARLDDALLDHSNRAVAQAFDLLEQRALAYNDDLGRFPMAVVAAVSNLDAPGFTGQSADPAAPSFDR